MTIKFSKGKFVKDENGRIIYTGKVPEGLIGREVMILEESDLDLLVRGELPSLLTQQIPMDKELYDGNQPHAPFFEDYLEWVTMDGTKNPLYLDRHIYTPNPTQMIFIRYASIEQSLNEQPIPD